MKAALLIPPGITDADAALGELVAAAQHVSSDVEVVSLDLDMSAATELAARAGVAQAAVLSKPLDATLASYPDNLVAAASVACNAVDVVLIPAGPSADDLAPRLAFRLGAAFVGNCIEIGEDDTVVTFSRSICGGRAIETVTSERPKTVITLARKRFAPAKGAATTCASRVVDTSAIAFIQPELGERESASGDTARRLTQSSIVVAGGRGLGTADGFNVVNELAATLGAAVGASRAAVDAGWVPHSIQVGQTGKVIAPDIYIAIGISGAPQHVAGIAGAKLVIAINSDEQAPIFQWAHLGIVDDYRPVVAELINALRSKKTEAL
jgi:electron transfer flavoprotein alpha subunit